MTIYILFAALIGGFALFHAVKYIKGSKKHHMACANITLVVIAIASLVMIQISDEAVESDKLKYSHVDGLLVSGTQYDSENKEYYVFTQYGPKMTDTFVVAASDAELPLMCRLLGEVTVFYKGVEQVSLNGENCYRAMNAVKIIPDYVQMFLWLAIITVLILIGFNIIIAAAYFKCSASK